MTDHAAFLSAIIADPASDAPRLIYADWLEEHGDAPRAEFIRVQCELATAKAWAEPHTICHHEVMNAAPCNACCKCHACALRQRERELLGQYGGLWAKPWGELFSAVLRETRPVVHAQPVMFRRGFIAEVHTTLAGWMGGDSRRCDKCGVIDADKGPIATRLRYCTVCGSSSMFTLPGHGPAIVQQQPVEVVRITDKRPSHHESGGKRWSGWTKETHPSITRDELPYDIWHFVNGAMRCSYRKDFPTPHDAEAALSAACLAWAKSQVPQLVPA